MSTMELKVPRTIWHVAAHNAAGELLWEEENPNIVFEAAINDLLAVYFKDGTKKPNWYIGLINSPATLALTDTLASHPGWTENTNYVSATRKDVVFSPPASRSINSTASKAVFTITGAGGNIFGTFLCSENTKGGTAGILYAAAGFANGAKLLSASDTLTVAVVITGA